APLAKPHAVGSVTRQSPLERAAQGLPHGLPPVVQRSADARVHCHTACNYWATACWLPLCSHSARRQQILAAYVTHHCGDDLYVVDTPPLDHDVALASADGSCCQPVRQSDHCAR